MMKCSNPSFYPEQEAFQTMFQNHHAQTLKGLALFFPCRWSSIYAANQCVQGLHQKKNTSYRAKLARGRDGVGSRYDTGIITYYLSYLMRALPFPLHHLTWSLDSVSITISANHRLFTNIWVTPSLDVTYFLCAWNLHWFSENCGVINGQVKRTDRAFSCEFGLNLTELGTNSKAVFPCFLQYLLSRRKSSHLTPAP